MMSEEQFVNYVLAQLEPYFLVYPERWSEDGKSRIDVVLKDKISDAIFGLELKRVDYKRGHECWKLIDQSLRYSKCKFSIGTGYQQIPIFICPALSRNMFICPDEKIEIEGKTYYSDRHCEHHEHHSFNGFIGGWNIGELKKVKCDYPKIKEYIIFITKNKPIWSSQPIWPNYKVKGLHEVNYNKLLKDIQNDNHI